MNKLRRGDYSGRPETMEQPKNVPTDAKDPNNSGPRMPMVPGGRSVQAPSFTCTPHPFKKGKTK